MNLILYGVIALAILGTVAGLYGTVHHSGVAEGRAEVQANWDAANKKAQERRDANRDAAKLTADTSAALLAVAQQKATTFESKWRLERGKHPNSTLAGCSGTPPAASTGGQATHMAPGAVRFSAGFLRLWDGAWTGTTGQPVFGDQPAPALGSPAPADALTGIGPGEVLDNHAANAESCSRDRRKLDALISQIEKLRAGWK